MVASKPANVPPLATQFPPPSIEYSNGAVPPVAVMVIVPSATPQSVGFVDDTFVMLGALGIDKLIGLVFQGVLQEPSVFLTNTLNVPAPKPLKVPVGCQFVPPSIEYSNDVPVATITIVPSFTPQLVGSVGVTFVMIGCTLSVITISASVTIQVPSAFLTRIG